MSTQLISGRIADFIPIGQDGQPIYLNAEAFRAALAITPLIGEEKVKYLAIPKIRADGQNIDWYVPFPPQVNSSQYHIVSWAKASPAEQQKALAMLDSFEQSLKRLGQDLTRRAGDSKSMLFAHYLTGQNAVQQLPAIHFPGPEYIYIVDGIPVITFWGFSSKNDSLANGPFYLLHHPELAMPAAAAATPFVAAAPAIAANQSAPTQPQQYPIVKRESHFPKWLWWLIPLLLLLLWIFLWLLPHMGLYGEQKSVFDKRYDSAVSEITSDGWEQKQPNTRTEQHGTDITRDHGTLLERVPNKVDELQETTDPDEVRELLDAPDLTNNTNSSNNSSTRTSTSDSRYASERNVSINNEYHVIDGRDPDASDASNAAFAGSDTSTSNTNVDDSRAYSSDYNEQVDINVDRDVLIDNGSAPEVNGTSNDAGTSANNSFESNESFTSSGSSTSDVDQSYSATYTIGGDGFADKGDGMGAGNGNAKGNSTSNDTSNSNDALAVDSNEVDVVNGAGTDNGGSNGDRPRRLGSLPPVDPFGDDGDAAFAQEQAAMQAQQAQANRQSQGQGSNGVPEDEREILSFTTDTLAKQGTSVFNGNWIARSGLMDSISGKPLQLGYKVSNGEGQAVVHRSDRVQCVADISLETKSNSFSISPADRARCPDNTTYRLPKVQCETNADGQVKCWGNYANRRFPIRLYRE